MSRQSFEKYAQGYAKPSPKTLPVCMNCVDFTSVVRHVKSCDGTIYLDETIKMCKLGNFACQKMATCYKFHLKKLSSSPDVQPDGPCIANTQIKCQTNEAAASDGASVPSRAAGGEGK